MTFELHSTARSPHFDVEEAATRRGVHLDPRLEPAFVARGAGAKNLARLFSSDALCVTTGQQPGLLTGPLYTVYKALSAVALAHSLEARLRRPVVPVFWVAGDDHDFAEANHIHVLSRSGDVRRVGLRNRSTDEPLTPVYREPIGPEIDGVLAALSAETPESEFRPAVFEWIRRHYQPAADMATAFAHALAELLDRFGLVVFNPTHVAAKRIMAPWLLGALEAAVELETRISARIARLEANGQAAPVAVGGGTTLVMVEASQGRDRLMVRESGFETRRSGERWSLGELRTAAHQEPSRLSPNVLLRPVVEAAILPTVAYVAGPGELAYLEECDPIYETLGIQPQQRVARWSGLVLERHVAKVLRKFGVTADDLREPEGPVEARLARDKMPAAATDAISVLRRTVQAEYARLADASADVDPTLKKHVQSSARNVQRDLADIEKRIVGHLKKQNEIMNQQIAKARANLYPAGKSQERIFNAVPFLIRYGQEFIDSTFQACAAWSAPLETVSGRT